jgi:hypothetical protein
MPTYGSLTPPYTVWQLISWTDAVTVIIIMTSIGDERDLLERTFIYIVCKFQLVWLKQWRWQFFWSRRRFQNGTKSRNKVCIKLKKTGTETFLILKSVCSEKCLWRIIVLEWHKRFKEGLRKWECKNRGWKQCWQHFFLLKITFVINLCRKTRLWTIHL